MILNIVKTVEVSERHTMGIYEVPDNLQEKYGGKYFLSSAVFNDWWLQNHTIEETLDDAKSFYYEGFFETEREAYLTAMLVKASSELDAVRYAIKNIKVTPLEWDM